MRPLALPYYYCRYCTERTQYRLATASSSPTRWFYSTTLDSQPHLIIFILNILHTLRRDTKLLRLWHTHFYSPGNCGPNGGGGETRTRVQSIGVGEFIEERYYRRFYFKADMPVTNKRKKIQENTLALALALVLLHRGSSIRLFTIYSILPLEAFSSASQQSFYIRFILLFFISYVAVSFN